MAMQPVIQEKRQPSLVGPPSRVAGGGGLGADS